jgi:hypothetical protein
VGFVKPMIGDPVVIAEPLGGTCPRSRYLKEEGRILQVELAMA